MHNICRHCDVDVCLFVFSSRRRHTRLQGDWSSDVCSSDLLDGIREGKDLRAEIGEGQKSTILCHLGNIAWRTGHTIDFDPKERKIVGDPAASTLTSRAYRKGWEPKV